MSLGSIAHLQYYFARTGLLDGKGGQLAKDKRKSSRDSINPAVLVSGDDTDAVVDSPIDGESILEWEIPEEPVMLPPTVSTYSHRNHFVPPPPDMKILKKDLVDSLEEALRALESTASPGPSHQQGSDVNDESESRSKGFEDILSMHILDTVTLAIRNARLYYTSHSHPERLAKIRSERQIRKELLAVLSVLKTWAARKFEGGLREEERLAILVWLSEVGQMVDKETRLEEAEKREREGWRWMSNSNGRWDGKERDREWAFLCSLRRDNSLDQLPEWTQPVELPSPFLETLADGRKLIQLHNAAVHRSKRRFGEIKSHHDDVAKPYRRAENLRYWIKAAEIRWEIKLKIDVMGVVYAKGQEPWRIFEEALMQWCKCVRRELTRDWKEASSSPSRGAAGHHMRNSSSIATVTPMNFEEGQI